MNPDIFAEFLSRQGYKITQTNSCYWYNAQPGFYFYFPYHKLIDPNPDEIGKLTAGKPFIGARYFTFPSENTRNSFLLVCEDKNYDLNSVDANYARRQTRRGLEHFKINQIDFKELEKKGLPLVHDTLSRQGRDTKIWKTKKWHQYCHAAIGLEGFEAWGAFSDGHLAAFMISFLMHDHFTILHHSSSTKYLPLYSNNALVYSVTKEKLSHPDINCLFYGPESLDAPESLDKFKFRMGFVKKPMKQKIVFNPIIKPFINSNSYKMFQWISNKYPSSDLLRKMVGVVDFFRESE
jgi:hypothetical protein